MPGKKSNKKLYWIIGILSVMIIGGIIIGKNRSQEASVSVSMTKVAFRSITERVSASGKVQPEVEVKISSDVPGEIIEMLVKEGDSVTAGQLLCRIRPDNYRSALDRAQAAVNTTKANLEQLKAQLAQSEATQTRNKIEYDRNKKLFDQKVISDQDWQQVIANFETGKKQIESAKAAIKAGEFQVKSAMAGVEDAAENLRKTNIFAPTSGTVSKLAVEKGERVVGTSQMAGTEIMRIANLRNMEVLIDVNENDIVRIHKGDSADIDVDSYSLSGKKFKGIVTEIANTAKTTASADAVTEFEVKVRIVPESYKDLVKEPKQVSPFRPGMTASVDIITARKSKVMSVPVSSVVTRDNNSENDESNGKEGESKTNQAKEKAKPSEVVFILKNGRSFKRVVKTGISDFEFIEILEGLKDGEEIISGPYLALSKDLQDSTAVIVVPEGQLNTTSSDKK